MLLVKLQLLQAQQRTRHLRRLRLGLLLRRRRTRLALQRRGQALGRVALRAHGRELALEGFLLPLERGKLPVVQDRDRLLRAPLLLLPALPRVPERLRRRMTE